MRPLCPHNFYHYLRRISRIKVKFAITEKIIFSHPLLQLESTFFWIYLPFDVADRNKYFSLIWWIFLCRVHFRHTSIFIKIENFSHQYHIYASKSLLYPKVWRIYLLSKFLHPFYFQTRLKFSKLRCRKKM